MATVERSALVPYSPEQMFEIVCDVRAYPEFLPWCTESRLIAETDEEQLAELALSKGGITQRFSTRNTLVRPSSIELKLIEGPFSRLQGVWQFKALGESGCKVELNLSFELDSTLMQMALGQVWRAATDRMVSAFCGRAEALYG